MHRPSTKLDSPVARTLLRVSYQASRPSYRLQHSEAPEVPSKSTMTEDYRWQLNVVGWTLCSIAIVMVVARSYCRFFVKHSFGADDALMVLSLVCFFFQDALVLLSHILGSWYCYDSIGVYRCDPRLWSAS